jgi:phage-related tail protein
MTAVLYYRSVRTPRIVGWLLLALVAATGCSSKSLTPEQEAQADLSACDAEIRKVVADPARADQLVALTDEFNKLGWQSIASVTEYRARVAALNSNYDATREHFETLISKQDAVREAFLKKALALREQMAALATDAEWEQLKSARLRALENGLQQLSL